MLRSGPKSNAVATVAVHVDPQDAPIVVDK